MLRACAAIGLACLLALPLGLPAGARPEGLRPAVLGLSDIPSDLAGVLQSHGARLLRVDRALMFAQILAPTDPGALEGLAGLPFARQAEWDQPAHALWTPNDPKLPQQKRDLDTVHAEAAWDLARGRPDVVIAIVDSGLDETHEDLQGALWTGNADGGTGWPYDDTPYFSYSGETLEKNRQREDLYFQRAPTLNDWVNCKNAGSKGFCLSHNADLTERALEYAFLDSMDHDEMEGSALIPLGVHDDMGHGTLVAGIAAARTNNGVGIAGICGDCSIMRVKVINAVGGGWASNIASGIRWAVDHGASVVSCSLGVHEDITALRDASAYAIAHDVLLVAAAGNDGSHPVVAPARYPGVLAVGTDFISYYMGDVLAPGGNVLSTVPVTVESEPWWWGSNSLVGSSPSVPDGYTIASGSSVATPFVSGTVGLMLSRAKDIGVHLSAAELRAKIIGTAILPGIGKGTLQMDAAVQAVV